MGRGDDHGSNADGVKYVSTTNANTVLNNVITEVPGTALPAMEGSLLEPTATNYFLNPTAPVTQAAMVTGGTVPHTLSITGDWTVTVDGSAPQSSAATYTFTPGLNAAVVITGGTTGTVQIEDNPFATSFVPSTGVAKTRDVTTMSLPIANLDSDEGTMVFDLTPEFNSADVTGANSAIVSIDASTTTSMLHADTTNGRLTLNDGVTVARPACRAGSGGRAPC